MVLGEGEDEDSWVLLVTHAQSPVARRQQLTVETGLFTPLQRIVNHRFVGHRDEGLG